MAAGHGRHRAGRQSRRRRGRRTRHRRPDPRQDLPRRNQGLERSGPRQAEPARQAARRRPSPSFIVRTVRAPRFNFTDYLSKVSADWKSKVGSAPAVEWPIGLAAKGNEGVANTVANTKGSIGYVEYAYAKQNKMTYAKMVNHDGKTVAPTMEAFQAAAANADWANAPGYYQILTDQKGAASWPITAATFILVHEAAARMPPRRRRSAEVLRLGVQEWRQGSGSARLHPHARQCRRHDQEDLGRGHQDRRRQAGLRRQISAC